MPDIDASLRDHATAAEPKVSALRDGIVSAVAQESNLTKRELFKEPIDISFDHCSTGSDGLVIFNAHDFVSVLSKATAGLTAAADLSLVISPTYREVELTCFLNMPLTLEELRAARLERTVFIGQLKNSVAEYDEAIAKAIEAQSDKTGTGLAVGESADPQGFAQGPPPPIDGEK